MIKYVLLALLLTGCYPNFKCVNGQIWVNAHPFALDNIYQPTAAECREFK